MGLGAWQATETPPWTEVTSFVFFVALPAVALCGLAAALISLALVRLGRRE
jgi:hypothetical protein